MPGFEEVGDDIDSFFKTGELPASLQGEYKPPPTTEESAETSTQTSESSTVAEPPKGEEAPAGTTPSTSTPQTPAAPTQQPQTDYSDLIRQQEATLKGLQKQLTDMQAAKQAEIDAANAPVMPDPEKDPLGYLTFQIKQVGDQVKAMKDEQVASQKEAQQKTQETEQQTQFRQFIDGVNGKVQEHLQTFADFDPKTKTSADYTAAYQHLVDMRTSDYMAMGFSKQEALAAVGQEEIRIAANAMREGKNPGVVAYELAKRHGYVPKVQTAQNPNPEAKLDSIKKGLETSGAERGTPPPTYSTDSVKSMNHKQLTDAVENHWDEMFGRSKSKGIFD